MKIVLIVVGVLVATIVVIVLIGTRLPVKHVASRSLRLSRSPAEVYAAVRNVEEYPRWREGVKKVELLSSAQFRETSSNGVVTYSIDEDVPNRKLVTRIVEKNLGYSGSWTYDIVAVENGTQLTITENGEVTNPLFRFLSRFVFGHTATIDGYLKSLEKR